ncbi:reverse transcriptase [Hordeum vulgare]|nr:reverse transcriptase [Hordeum vulgare]
MMAVLLKLFVGDNSGFSKLNHAHIVLIPKKLDAQEVGDFRPMSLPHSVAKLFAKMLAIRAKRMMKDIVAANQSAFILDRSLHDNFLLVRQVARRFHSRRDPGVFLKLDISRTFDSLVWSFLFDVLRTKGFGSKWIGWVAALLNSASTNVIVNGVPGRSFVHAKGLRDGDPISPLPFVIAMDVLTSIINKAESDGIISAFTGVTALQCLSIYADDVALFIRPSPQDMGVVRNTLHIFGEASGLKVNYT